jgi:hypothetical protein
MAEGSKMPPSPHGLLLDYGGTLVEEVGVDLRAGNAGERREQ